jgi:glutamine amidotransferase
MITVVDYGMGNLRSVSKALESLGAAVCVSSRPQDVTRAEELVVPGVGAFPAAMRELADRGLIDPIKAFLASGKPYLGICLGLQLLFDESEEGGGAAGLGVLSGTVRRFPSDATLKVPHMGWNQVLVNRTVRGEAHQGCPLLEGIPPESFFYFVHSYYADPSDRSVSALETDYGVRFTAMVWRDNLYATQFHPEKSQALGLRLLENFIRLGAG